MSRLISHSVVIKVIVAGVLFAAPMGLSGCGFSPLYATGSATNAAAAPAAYLDQVYIDNIPDREGQYLRNLLIDRFYSTGRPEQPLYTLSVEKLTETETELDLTKSAEATRAQLRYSGTLVLTDTRNGQEVLRQPLSSITSYNILQSEFSTRVTEDNARLDALKDIARQIELNLSLYFKRLP